MIALPGADALASIVGQVARPGDLVVCLGAGNITQWAAALPAQLQVEISGSAAKAGQG